MAGTDPYRIRDFVPEFEAISAEFAARSREMSACTTIRADIPYGSRPREVIDLVLPRKPTRGVPLHIFVHGGYWRSGEKADYRLIAEPVLAAGGMAALVEYDLMPDQRLAILVDQVRRAVLWLQDQAASFGADAERITVSGHSAGAHLASYLAAWGPQEEAAPELPELKAMLLLSGIYDLSDIPTSFLRSEAEMTQEEAAAWSPLASSHLPGPKRILAFGEEETPPFHDQAIALDERLAAEGLPAELLTVPGANHMSVVLDLADPDGVLGKQVADLVSTA